VIRKARVDDVKKIKMLINHYAKLNQMLPRSLNELYENIRDFSLYTESDKIYGCCALHVGWEDLAEIKSLAVARSRTKRGIGAKLLKQCLAEARILKVKKVFALTYIPDFFTRFGFKLIDKQELPHKIWSECVKCVHFPDCGENAMMKEM